jgi:hypothetical protein
MEMRKSSKMEDFLWVIKKTKRVNRRIESLKKLNYPDRKISVIY